jgi:hypothetical protein
MEGQRIDEAHAEEKERLGFLVSQVDAADGREAWPRVDVSREAMNRLENGAVADDTRLAVRTQGRSPVEAAVKRRGDPPPQVAGWGTQLRLVEHDADPIPGAQGQSCQHSRLNPACHSGCRGGFESSLSTVTSSVQRSS